MMSRELGVESGEWACLQAVPSGIDFSEFPTSYFLLPTPIAPLSQRIPLPEYLTCRRANQ